MAEQPLENIQLALALDLETKDTAVQPTARIKLANEIINAKYNIKLKEFKLLFAVLSQIQPEEGKFCLYRFKVKDLATAIGITPGKGYFSEVRKLANQLRKTDVYIQKRQDENEEKEQWIDASFISSIENTGDGYMEIALDPKLHRYFFDLREQFTKMGIQDILKFKSIYTQRIYGFIKQYEKTGYRRMKIDKIKEDLMIQNKYKLFSDLKRFVIEPAVKEINETTNFEVSYETDSKKAGVKVTEIFFHFRKKNNTMDRLSDDELKTYNLLISKGITSEKVEELFELYDYNRIKNNLDYALKCDTNKKNLAGFIVSSITNNYIREIQSGEKQEITSNQNEQRINQIIKRLRDLPEKEKIKTYSDLLKAVDNKMIIKEKLSQMETLDNALDNPITSSLIAKYYIEIADSNK